MIRALPAFAFIFLCMVSAASSQTWQQLSPYPSPEQSQNIYLRNATTVYASGTNGSLIKSTDAGATWQRLQITSTGDIIDGLCFTSDLVGYACGYHYSIYKTTDGGQTWSVLERQPGVTLGFIGIAFIDANTGFAVGNNGLIRKTTDAGATWTTVATSVTSGLNKILYLGDNTLIICGSDQMILRSTDGGATWNTVNSGTSSPKLAMSTADGTTIYASTSNSTISKSTDKGASWVHLATPPTTFSLFGISFVSATTGYIADQYGGVFKTTDGADTWTACTTGISGGENFYSIGFIDENTGMVIGYGGSLYRTTDGGAHWTHLNKGISGSEMVCGAWFTDANTGYAASSGDATIYKTTDGGINWSSAGTTGAAGMTDMVFVDATHAFGVTTAPGFLKTTDAGATWTAVDLASTGLSTWPAAISFPTLTTGYIADAGSSVVKTTNGGDSWTVIKSDFPQILSACMFLDANNGYVAGAGGYIGHTINGGGAWTEQASTVTATLWSIAFLDASVGIAVGDAGAVVTTTDGGATWADHSIATPYTLYKVRYLSASTILAVGGSGAAFLSTDAGAHWSDISYGSTDFYTIAASGSSIWLLGASGVVVKNLVALPVELTAFTASAVNGGVLLQWNTATEVNNYGFEIERSVAGVRPESAGGRVWKTIAFVPGSGNSASPKRYSYMDASLMTGGADYRLRQIDRDGKFHYSTVLSIETTPPRRTELAQNFPNPFNPSTSIRFTLTAASDVRLDIIDVAGRMVKELAGGFREAGSHVVSWNGRGESGLPAASGVYFCRLTVNGSPTGLRKIHLLK